MVSLVCIIGGLITDSGKAEAADYYVCLDERENEVWISGPTVKIGENEYGNPTWECTYKTINPHSRKLEGKSHIKYTKERTMIYWKRDDGSHNQLMPQHKTFVAVLTYIWQHRDMK